MTTDSLSLQEQYAPNSICFGCGPANAQGLKIRSFAAPPDAQGFYALTATFEPTAFHEAYPGMINGGIIGTLMDCHSNWAAAYNLMRTQKTDNPPCTVTAEFHVRLRRPTPSGVPLEIKAWPSDVSGSKVRVTAELRAAGEVTATCEGTFVAVKPGHPAYHRWG